MNRLSLFLASPAWYLTTSSFELYFFLLVECVYTCVYVCEVRENTLYSYHKTHTALSNVHINLRAGWSYMTLTSLFTEKPGLLLPRYEWRNSLTAPTNLSVCWIHFRFMFWNEFSLFMAKYSRANEFCCSSEY